MHAFFMAGSYSFVTTVTGRRLPSISACPTNFSLSCAAEHYSEEFEGRKGHTRQAKEALAKSPHSVGVRCL